LVVSFDELEKIKPLLREYVELSPKSVERQWEPYIESSQHPFYESAGKENQNIAHHLLMFAVVDTADLVTMPENARALLRWLSGALSDNYFKPCQIDLFRKHIQYFANRRNLGPSYEKIPEILDSINHFVQENAKGDLVSYAKKFATPEEMVKEVGNNISYIRESHLDHARMYMLWMVRSTPDLGIFKNFKKQQLQIPLTSFMRNIAYCLGLCSKTADWNDLKEIDKERKRLTQFALELFPEDPAKIDYPFFMLGRWMSDSDNLNLRLLRQYLQFLKNTYYKIQKPPISYKPTKKSKMRSNLEEQVKNDLEQHNLQYIREPYQLALEEKNGEAPQYTPDFILSKSLKKNGKKVILEPHGIWTRKQKMKYQLGGKTSFFWAVPSEIGSDEIKFVNKLRSVRKRYKGMYYLILIVPEKFYSYIKEKKEYSDIYDEIHCTEDVPIMLFKLKKKLQ
tara:strand:+ start:1231 stop:2586 length:1356 start_codon:yes stop_codon:yes gene_type:complete